MGFVSWLLKKLEQRRGKRLYRQINSDQYVGRVKSQMQSPELEDAVRRRSVVNAWIVQQQGLDPTKIYDFEALAQSLGGYEHLYAVLEKDRLTKE